MAKKFSDSNYDASGRRRIFWADEPAGEMGANRIRQKESVCCLAADFVIDTHRQWNGQVFRAVSSRVGLLLDFKETEVPDAPQYLERIMPQPDEQGSAFTLHGYKGREMISTGPRFPNVFTS